MGENDHREGHYCRVKMRDDMIMELGGKKTTSIVTAIEASVKSVHQFGVQTITLEDICDYCHSGEKKRESQEDEASPKLDLLFVCAMNVTEWSKRECGGTVTVNCHRHPRNTACHRPFPDG